MPLLDDRNGRRPAVGGLSRPHLESTENGNAGGLRRSTRAFWSQSPVPEALARLDGIKSAPEPTAEETLGSGSSLAPRPRGLLSTCANPRCGSGWLHLWRSRSGPIFEGGWSCSASCTAARIEAAVRRELEGRSTGEGMHSAGHRHRIPLGLVMLEQGWITSEQLRKGIEAQRAAGEGRLGDWLVSEVGVSEGLVTRALSLQWNCPVLALDRYDPERMAAVLPRLFVEAFGALPLRLAAGSILYCGFEDRLDPVLTLAAERMFGLRVESGVVRGSLFEDAHARLLNARFPRAELIEAASETPLVRALTRAVERARPAQSRLVRVHDCLWLRMWMQQRTAVPADSAAVEDVIVSFASD